MYKNIYLTVLIFFFHTSFGQSDKDKIKALFTDSQKKYENQKFFKMEMIYTLYSTPVSKIKSEEYEGVIVKKNNLFYSKIDKSEKVLLEKHQIKVDYDSKLIQVTQVQKNNNNDLLIHSLLDLLNNFKEFNLSSTKEYWICTLNTGKITMIPYHKVVVFLNKSDNTIYKQELFFLEKYPYKDSKKNTQYDFPRLEIVFKKIETNIIEYESKFNLGNYVYQEGKFYRVSKNYKDFKIID